MRIALYQPDIPQNTGTLIRLASCLGVAIEIIEPCGFPFSVKALRRSGMDYLDTAQITHQASWDSFTVDPAREEGHLILLSTRGDLSYTDFDYRPGDTLLLGRESAGVPQNVHDFAHQAVVIPLSPPARSLNVAVAASMVLGEALRQTDGFPSGNGFPTVD